MNLENPGSANQNELIIADCRLLSHIRPWKSGEHSDSSKTLPLQQVLHLLQGGGGDQSGPVLCTDSLGSLDIHSVKYTQVLHNETSEASQKYQH